MKLSTMKRNLFVLLFIAPVLMAGCASPMSKESKQDLAKPVNCATAEADMRVLHAEKAHLGKEIKAGATAIIPIGLVAHLFKHTEGETLKVATGEYNKAIDKKITEIKTQCGI